MLIDIHTHLAWDIDDGMDTKEHAVIALGNAKKDGIKKIIATPHFIPGKHFINDKKRMEQRIIELSALAQNYDIEIYAGCEVFLNRDYISMIEDKAFIPLNHTKYVLVEFDVRKDIKNNEDAEDILYELEVHGYIPVIAHVERYFHCELDLKRIKSWMDSGYIIQVNRTSLMGMHGSRNETNVKKMLKNGCIHIIASDAHGIRGSRICKLSDAYNKLLKEYGKENADILCFKNPMHILKNESMESLKIKKGLFERMFGKGV